MCKYLMRYYVDTIPQISSFKINHEMYRRIPKEIHNYVEKRLNTMDKHTYSLKGY